MKFFCPNPILTTPLRGQSLKITGNTVKYIEHGVFGVAQFVFGLVLTAALINEDPQEQGREDFKIIQHIASSISTMRFFESLNLFLR